MSTYASFALVWPLAAAVFLLPLQAEEGAAELDGKTLDDWVAQLQSPNRGLQLKAAQVLSKAADAQIPPLIPKLIPLLKSERENDRFVAAQTLGNYGAAAQAAVSELLPVLEGTQFERNRAAAAKALGQILENAQPSAEIEKVTQALIAGFDDKYSDVRRESVKACGMIGTAAKACIPHLGKMLTQGVGNWQEAYLQFDAAAWTCGQMGPLASEHMDRLLGIILRTETTEVLDAIGKIGPVHENVAPNIMDRMEQVNAGSVHIQKGSRTPPMGGAACKAFMEHGFEVLAKFGPASASAVPFLARFIGKGCEGRKSYALGALKALGAIGPKAVEAISAIENNVLKSADADLRKAGEDALAKIRGQNVP